jgi:flagellar hook-associated protein 3 FlgL
MAMRVATFAMNDRMLAASMRTQARMAEMQLQEATGTVSTDYGGLGSSARKLISLEVSLERSKSYVAAATEAGSRIEVMYSTMSTITDLLSDFRAQITALKSTDASATSNGVLSSTAQTYMEELATLLNTQYEGRYLFGGSITTSRPVDLTSFIAADATTASTDYYQGDSAIAAVQVSSERSISYGITADNSAFEQALRALSVIASANGTFDTATLDAASNLIVSALEGATALQSNLSINAATLERAQTAQEDYQAFVTSSISNVRDVDVTTLAVKLASYESQLQASYSALAKLQALSISDYFR